MSLMDRIRTPMFEVQKALYTRLSTDLPAMIPPDPGTGIVTPAVYSFVAPDTAKLPLIVLSQISTMPAQFKGGRNRKVQALLDLWSNRINSTDEICRMIQATLESFSRAELIIEGGFRESFGMGIDEQCDLAAEPDANGIVYHGTIRYTWNVEDTNPR